MSSEDGIIPKIKPLKAPEKTIPIYWANNSSLYRVKYILNKKNCRNIVYFKFFKIIYLYVYFFLYFLYINIFNYFLKYRTKIPRIGCGMLKLGIE